MLCVWAARRRSLTVWILVSMVIGAEIGHDFPGVAMGLRVLAQIFLRLIRTIVASEVLELEGFEGAPEKSNEPKLEAIQMAWYEEWKDSE